MALRNWVVALTSAALGLAVAFSGNACSRGSLGQRSLYVVGALLLIASGLWILRSFRRAKR
jgi:hypothetical protein